MAKVKSSWKGKNARILVTGDKKLDKKIRELDSKVRAALQRSVLRKAAKIIADDAKANVPVDTGELKKSIVMRALAKSRLNKNRAGMRVLARAFHARLVEFGFLDQPGRPYLLPAARRNQARVKATIIEETRKKIAEIARKK